MCVCVCVCVCVCIIAQRINNLSKVKKKEVCQK